MLQTARGLGVLLLAAGACAALTGCLEKEASSREEDSEATARKLAAAQLREHLFTAHHDRCVEVFVKAEGFGERRLPTLAHVPSDYPRSLELPPEAHVPADPRPGEPLSEPAASAWLMKKVELVGLLNHEKPVVYPAEGRMGSRRTRPKVRDLDEFEQGALPALQGGEQVRMAEAPGTVRLLGAIRARKDCQKCHDKPEGTLLGAFTYVFEQAKP